MNQQIEDSNDDEEEDLEEELNEQDHETIRSFPSTCLTPGSFTDWDRLESRLATITAQKGASATTTTTTTPPAGATEGDFMILLNHLREDGVENPELPPTLERFYQTAATFQFYEFVTFASTEACTPKVLLEYIFGDDELRKDAAAAAAVEVAKPGWIGLAATGDSFGMLLINCNPASCYFGQVWNYTNNQNVEHKVVSCLDTLLERIVQLLEWNEDGKQSLKLEYEVFNTASNLAVGLQ